MASIICESPRKFEDVKKRVEDYILEQENHFAIWQKVMDVLKDYDGKIVSKRMETSVKKALPDYTIYLENDYLIIFHIWGKELGSHEKRLNIYLRKGKDALNPSAYSHSITLENSGYFPFIPERNRKLKASLANDGKIIKLMVDEFNNHIAMLQSLNERAENFGYPLSSLLDIKS